MLANILSRFWWTTLLRGLIWVLLGVFIFAKPAMSLVSSCGASAPMANSPSANTRKMYARARRGNRSSSSGSAGGRGSGTTFEASADSGRGRASVGPLA